MMKSLRIKKTCNLSDKMIVINFKNYKSGRSSIDLAGKISKYLDGAIICVPANDIGLVSSVRKVKIYAQHVNALDSNRATGFVGVTGAKKSGAIGSLLNHSEHRISSMKIEKVILRARKVGLKIILCVKDIGEVRKYRKLNPYAIAFEDKALIGTKKSITSYRQKEIREFVKILKGSGIKALCGAGVHSVEDVVSAKKLGCNGVLIASAVANAKSPEKFLKALGKI